MNQTKDGKDYCKAYWKIFAGGRLVAKMNKDGKVVWGAL